MPTRGIHLIWTTYGTWLPGDDRGHWSPLFDCYGNVIRRGGRLNQPDAATRQRALCVAKEERRVLDPDAIALVARTLGGLLTPVVGQFRTPIYAAAVEPTHVHLLIGPVDEDISRFTGRLKGVTSSEIVALPGNEGRRRTWTAGFWKVFLFDDIGLEAVANYVEAHNVRHGLPAAPFDWVTPLIRAGQTNDT